jgi:hypothetical protein
MMRKVIGFKILVTFFVLAIAFSSCKAPREIKTEHIKSISTAKLLKNIESTSLAYDYLNIGRINCQFATKSSRTTFRVSVKAIRDEKILASITKLNIPVARVLLTPDSVIYVSYIEHTYFTDDYTYLSNFLNIDLDFTTLQAFLSNSAFSYRNDKKDKDFRTFNTSVEDGKYVLQSEREQKVMRLGEKANPNKLERRFKRLDETALILQKMYFNPENFALVRLLISDKTNNREAEINFGDFVELNGKDYPGAIDVKLESEDEKVELNVQMSSFSTEKPDPFHLKIPENYKKIEVN